jgi:hypothetical protein
MRSYHPILPLHRHIHSGHDQLLSHVPPFLTEDPVVLPTHGTLNIVAKKNHTIEGMVAYFGGPITNICRPLFLASKLWDYSKTQQQFFVLCAGALVKYVSNLVTGSNREDLDKPLLHALAKKVVVAHVDM